MGYDEYRRDSGDSISTRLTYLLIGGGIGAILALLFAPKSGHELRGDIADATRKGIDRSREAAQQLTDRAGESPGFLKFSQIPERSGFPSGVRGAGAFRSGLPSAARGTPGTV